jgi:opacity protein-like surface antigen
MTCGLLGTATAGLAQTSGPYLRASTFYQMNRSVALTDNLAPGGPLSWFGFPGLPGEGSRHPQSDSLGGGLALGYRFSPLVRLDVSYDQSVDSTLQIAPYGPGFAQFDLRTRQLMVNATLDMAPLFEKSALGPIHPYLTAGIGQSRNRNGDYYCFTSLAACNAAAYPLQATQTALAWQAGLGLQWPLSTHVILDAGWKYLSLGETRGANDPSAGGLHGKLTANRFSLGLVFPFGGSPER